MGWIADQFAIRVDQLKRLVELYEQEPRSESGIKRIGNRWVQAGWVESRPGPTGGYTLAADLTAVSFLDVIEVVEGSINGETCILAGGPCGQDEYCSLHDAWQSASGAMRLSFSQIPIADGI